jgi:hypothetical protein
MCTLVYGTNRRTLVNYSSVVGNSSSSTTTGSQQATSAANSRIGNKSNSVPVCFAWSSHGECDRYKCSFPHPENKRAELGTCFNWRDHGECRFGNKCKYKHVLPTQAIPSTPKAASKPAINEAAAASNNMDNDGFTVVMHKRKRTLDGCDLDTNEQNR